MILPEPLDSLDSLTWSVYADCLEEHQASDVQVQRARRVAKRLLKRAPKRVLCVDVWRYHSDVFGVPGWRVLTPGPIHWDGLFGGFPVKGEWLMPNAARLRTRQRITSRYRATVLDFLNMHLHVPSLARAYFTVIARNVRLS
jgi:hypothetical protein